MNSQEKKVFFEENGYLKLDLGLTEDYCQKIILELAKSYQERSANRLTDAWQQCGNVKQLADNQLIKKTLLELLGREPIPFQTLNFCTGSEQKSHSDTIHFHSLPPFYMCGVWIALEDIKPESGPLHYYPGSHKLPIVDTAHIGGKLDLDSSHEHIYQQYEAYMEEYIASKQLRKEVLSIKRGEALIWSANLLHGGEAVETLGLSRHNQVTHYYFKDCHYFTPLFSDVPKGELLDRSIMNISTGETYSAGFSQRQVKSGLKQLRAVSHDYKTTSLTEKMITLKNQCNTFFKRF